MPLKVLDSWCLMAFFSDQAGGEEFEDLLHKAELGKHTLLLSVVNWGEVYCATMRGGSQSLAEEVTKEIAGMPIEIIPVAADLELTRQAAAYKATWKMSYADCFAAALAKLRNAELVTGDDDFRQVEKDIKIAWLAR